MAFLQNIGKPLQKPKNFHIQSAGTGNKAIFGALGVAVVVVAIYLGFFFYGQYLEAKTNSVSEEIASTKQELTQLMAANREAESFAQRLEVLPKLVDQHTYWTNLLTAVNERIPQTVQFETLSAEFDTRKITIAARTTSFTEIAKTIVSIKSLDAVERVTFSNVSYNPREGNTSTPVRFQMVVTLSAAALTTPPELASEDQLEDDSATDDAATDDDATQDSSSTNPATGE